MNIRIIAVGKLKQSYLVTGINEYTKRLQAYGRVEIIEVKDESFTEPLSDKETSIIKEKEAERILAQIPDRYYVIALDQRGKQLDSLGLAELINHQGLYHQGSLVFIIGGALGLSESIIQRADYVLSFSQLTFPHQLMRLILIEQIYRAMTIIHHEKYHK